MRKLIGIATRSKEDPQYLRLLAALDDQTERPPRHVVEGRTVAQARNAIVDAAIAEGVEAVLFVDTDETPASPDWIREITDFQGADIVAGPVIPYEVRNGGARYLADLEKELVVSIPQNPTVMLTGNSAWKLGVFQQIQDRYGYIYDESLWSRGDNGARAARVSYGGEDWDLNLRAARMGFRVRFNPQAGVHHDYSSITWTLALKKRYRYCVGGALAYLKNRQLLRRAGGALRGSPQVVLDLPIKTAALFRALLLHYGDV
ncbi:MAG: glycosyltransferase family 2 protein [Thermoplasmata archaeon]